MRLPLGDGAGLPRARSARRVWVYTTGAAGVRARRGPGLLHHPGAGAGGRVARVHGQRRAGRPRRSCSRSPTSPAVFSVMGFSFSGAAPNQGIMFVRLKPFDERHGDEHSAQAIVARLRGKLLGGISGAIVVAVPAAADPRPRRVRRVRVRGARPERRRHREPGGGHAGAGAARGNQSPSCAGCSRRSPPTTRSCYVTIDRERAQGAGHAAQRVTDALQIFLGSQYVNDFDFNNRAYRVYVQADQLPHRPDDAGAVLRAGAQRADGAARRTWCTSARRPRRRSSATSTCSGRRRSTARRRRASARARRCRRWSSWPTRTLPHGHELRVVRAFARGDQGRHAGRS